MKKRMTGLVAAAVLLLSQGAAAQDKGAIRKAYSEVKQCIELQKDVPEMQNSCVVSLHQNVPGTGVQKIDYNLYFSAPETDSCGVIMPRRLLFASSRFNVAARMFYEEYLFNDDGNPIFVFCRHDDDDVPGGFFEKRMYFKDDGSLISIRVSGSAKGKGYVIYEGDGTGCPERYLNDDYSFAKGIKAMFGAICQCIKL